MIELLVGAAIGAVGGAVAKDKLSGTNNQLAKLQNDLNSVSEENEKLRKRYKEAERQVEDLLAEKNKLQRASKSNSDDKDDMEDELDEAKLKIKKLTVQNDELMRKLQEYKAACSSYENEIAALKNK